MKYLGIDYGAKRVGLAISNSEGSMSTPLSIIENTEYLAEQIAKITSENMIDAVVIGESKNLSGHKNPIATRAEGLGKTLDEQFGLPVLYHTEIFTSMESKWGIEKQVRRSGKDKQVKKTGARDIDDVAASIMLQSYLDSLG